MSSTFGSGYEHPTLQTPVTSEQRERAEQWLQQAYAEGRISEEDFDRRIGEVLEAGNRRQLNQAFYGLVEVPATHPSYPSVGYPQTTTGQSVQPASTGTGVGALAHFTGLFSWIVGPGAVYLLSSAGTASRREAAKAFNFQLIAGIAFALATIVSIAVPGDGFRWILGLLWVGWLALTIVGGVKAAQGANWRNPVKSVVKLDVLPEK